MFWIFIYIIHYCDVNVYFIYLHIKNVLLKLCIRFHISIYLFTTYILEPLYFIRGTSVFWSALYTSTRFAHLPFDMNPDRERDLHLFTPEAKSVGWYSDISFIWILFVYLGNASPYNFYHLSNKGERSLIQVTWYTWDCSRGYTVSYLRRWEKYHVSLLLKLKSRPSYIDLSKKVMESPLASILYPNISYSNWKYKTILNWSKYEVMERPLVSWCIFRLPKGRQVWHSPALKTRNQQNGPNFVHLNTITDYQKYRQRCLKNWLQNGTKTTPLLNIFF